jgi:ribosome-interacting GTPase 1
MPANLPPECTELERKYLEASTRTAKISALEKYLAAIPKHKGTERLCAQIKTKLAKFRLEEERRKSRTKPSYAGSKYALKKEGAAQVVLISYTGAGKSSLLHALTNAKPAIYGYPFTTIEPIPGMMGFEDIQIQLIEAPALFAYDGSVTSWKSKVLGLARNADALIVLVDLAADTPHIQLVTIFDELAKAHITMKQTKARVEIEKKETGGIQIVTFGNVHCKPHEIENTLLQMRIHHAIVKLWGTAEIDDFMQALTYGTVYKPTTVLANKIDIPGTRREFSALKSAFPDIDILATSTKSKHGITFVPIRIFNSLHIMRIYTKKPRQPPSIEPMIISAGSTVGDAAKLIHKDFYKNFKYAKIWGSSNFPGERVGLTYQLCDKDVLEIRV